MFLANKLNKGAGVPAPVDAQFNYVTMLLHGDGTNGAQNNTFLDSSTNNFTITRNGNTTQGSFSPYGSNWSNFFDGTGDYLQVAYNSAFNYSSSVPYTIDIWFYPTVGGTDNAQIVACQNGGTDNNLNWLMRQKADNTLRFVSIQSGGAVIPNDSTNTFNVNQWNHAAVVMTGSAIKLWLNGTYQQSVSFNGSQQVNGNITIGYWTTNYTGYVSNLRYTNTQVYTGTSNITVPTAPLTAVTGTQLLTCQSNRFIDTSANAFSITVNGNPSVQRFNPFGASTAYSTSVIGGSGYFDGSGDYLNAGNQTALHLGSGNFTVEMWLYKNANTEYMTACGDLLAVSTNTFQILGDATGSKISWYDGAGSAFTLTSTTSIPIGAWTHIAFVRSSTTLTLYVNGVSDSTASLSTNYNATTSFFVGHTPELIGSRYWNGYISNFRMVKGTAVYTAAFTPPTAPLTAVTNTSLLLLTINGAIFDNAMMNNLETVGNAQISTSVVKYGTGSLAFDGSGDWLVMPYGPTQNFGTGNFTIEMWAYLNSLSASYYVPAGTWGSGTSDEWLIQIQNNGSIRFLTTAGSTFYSASITTATWYHIAVVRSGTTVTIYVNGTSVGSYTCSNSLGSVSKTLYIGTQAGSWDWNGYIDDFRITNGYARYTTTFTPPTAAFPNIGPV
jgi:hypothetical protein